MGYGNLFTFDTIMKSPIKIIHILSYFILVFISNLIGQNNQRYIDSINTIVLKYKIRFGES